MRRVKTEKSNAPGPRRAPVLEPNAWTISALPAQTGDAKAAQCARGFHFHDIDVIFTDLPSILVPIFALAARRATATNNQKLPKTFRNLYNEIA